MQSVFSFDAATVRNKGQRAYQEDAIISDFASGAEMGLAVLSDGMGGHAAGDVASKIVVTEVFSELLFHSSDTKAFIGNAPDVLTKAAFCANACLKDHVHTYPETQGMGATLIAAVLCDRALYWISIGDSPLFLFRDGELTQLNEDHSLAPQIDFMVKSGLMDPNEAKVHPDRNTLTSVLFGHDIPKIDCPSRPTLMQEDDILIVASDGLQFLSNDEIRTVLMRHGGQSSMVVGDQLLGEVLSLNEPDLDNVSFAVIKVNKSQRDGRNQVLPPVPARGLRCVS